MSDWVVGFCWVWVGVGLVWVTWSIVLVGFGNPDGKGLVGRLRGW